MDTQKGSELSTVKNQTHVERPSDREILIRRTFDGPARLVFDAWTKPELLKRWWAPKSFGLTLLQCDADVRTGGAYRFVIGRGDAKMEFFGHYVEVVAGSRLVWTNEESGEGGSVTTVTFEEKAGKTLVVMREVYPSKEAFDAAGAEGACEGMRASFEQLDDVLGASASPS